MRSGDTAILLDCGLSMKELGRRCSAAGLRASSLDAVIVTHEHSDHVFGVGPVTRALSIPVFANRQTAGNCRTLGNLGSISFFTTGKPFRVGDLEMTAFQVPHDASEPVGFIVTDGRHRVGVATDLGSFNLDVIASLGGCDAVVLESNHDEVMLINGPYPWFLKRRVKGPLGHLSNLDAAAIARCVDHAGLQHVALAHLSRTNNTPDLPLDSTREALGDSGSRVRVSLGWQFEAGELLRLE